MSHFYTVGFHGVGGAVIEVAYVWLIEVRDALFRGHAVFILCFAFVSLYLSRDDIVVVTLLYR